MKMVSRRDMLAGSAIAMAMMATSAFAQTVDLSTLNEPSAIGEMALGPDTAKVTVIEYASATCPHCASFYKDVFKLLKTEYIDTGKIRFVFREFPHNDAAVAAFMVARCAPKEKYFPLVDVFFETQEKWMANPLEGLRAIAKEAGFTEETFNACLKNEAVAKGILDVRKKAEGYGIDSIPSFFINGVKYDGERTIEKFRETIDPLLA